MNNYDKTQGPGGVDAVLIDLQSISGLAHGGGPQWGQESEDLNLTLLSWPARHVIAPHTNNEVDVVLIAVAGTGEVTVNNQTLQLGPGLALLIPKGAERSIRSTSERFSYLSVHRRRRGLMPTIGGKPVS